MFTSSARPDRSSPRQSCSHIDVCKCRRSCRTIVRFCAAGYAPASRVSRATHFSLLESRAVQRRKSGDSPNLSGALSGGRNLPAPHAPWHGAKFRVSVLAVFLPHTHAKSVRMAEASSRHRWQRIHFGSSAAALGRRQRAGGHKLCLPARLVILVQERRPPPVRRRRRSRHSR